MRRVVALGIVNAGKSSLLSALADEEGLFPSGDVPRVTREIQQETRGDLLLVDTPGLDAPAEDVELAFQSATSAHTVLWCHSLRMGELRPTELSALQRYKTTNGLWRTCFVLTHGDNVASFEIVRVVSKRIAEQLGGVFGMRFVGVGEKIPPSPPGQRNPRPFNVVGTIDYWRSKTGSGPDSERRLNRSGVPRLRDFLLSLRPVGGP
ncbi:MAG: 50S ribosome-binding GTPase [Armatimonadetes bacterium]|nr:50S ribosome-binding GTPase [Armatimonadota bacterium]